jgi:hypothetical protein
VRVLVNEWLDWHRVSTILGRGNGRVDTHAAILRELEPVNKGRDKKNRITYSSLWVQAKRHYELAGITDWRVPDSRSAWFWSQVVIDTDFS